jgi:hypothetical protein
VLLLDDVLFSFFLANSMSYGVLDALAFEFLVSLSEIGFFFWSNCRSYGVSELARRINVVRFMLNTQVAVALVVSVLLVLWLWRRELAAGASVLLEP